MKKVLTLLSALLFTFSLLAQSPEKISFQMVLRDSNHELVTNQNIGMRISILQGSADGQSVYTETHIPRSNSQGLVSIDIGGGVSSQNFSTIDWQRGPYFVKTEADPSGGNNYSITGVSQILSVPYALHAKTAETILGGELSEKDPLFAASEAAKIGPLDIVNLSNLSGVNTGDQDLSHLATIKALQDSSIALRNAIPETVDFIRQETDPVFDAWDRSTGILIQEEQITDLKPYITEEKDPVFEANFDLNRAARGDIIQFDGRKWSRFTPNYLTGFTEAQKLSDVAALGNAINNQIKNLEDPSDPQDAVTKAYIDAILKSYDVIPQTFSAMISDIEGNRYKTVKIGNQVWMAENLKSTQFNDGTPIPELQDDNAWRNANGPGYCWYNNDRENLGKIHGALYNGYVLYSDPQKNVCPQGWHVPTQPEWQIFINTIADNGKLYPKNDNLWTIPYPEATDEYGFTALPSGQRATQGIFLQLGGIAFWHLKNTSEDTFSVYWGIWTQDPLSTLFGGAQPQEGFSIRCIRD